MMPDTNSAGISVCSTMAPVLSAYADGELEASRCGAVVRHLAECRACNTTFEIYRRMGQAMRGLEAAPPPPAAELKLRVVASHMAVRNQRWTFARLRLSMAIRSLALPMALGTAMALFLFSAFAGSVRGIGIVSPGMQDVEVGQASPPRLASAPDFPLEQSVLVEADIDATGHVYGYSVLAGRLNEQMRAQLNNQMVLSVFKPATTFFGQPTTGSVVVSFGSVDVRG